MPLDANIAGALEVRRQQIAIQEAVAGGVFENVIKIDIGTSGEHIAQVDFTVRFVEEPVPLSGWAMKPGQRLVAGSFPTVDAGVYTYKMGRRYASGATFYDGATVLIVASGPDDLNATVWLTLRGKAIRDPAGR